MHTRFCFLMAAAALLLPLPASAGETSPAAPAALPAAQPGATAIPSGSSSAPAAQSGMPSGAARATVDEATLALDRDCLNEAYPGFITGTETDSSGVIWFRTKTGARLVYDDGKKKNAEQLLRDADIEDSMHQPYPLEPSRPDLGPDEDPGRIRCYPLLRALYGADKATIVRNLRKVSLGPKRSVRLSPAPAEAFAQLAAEMQAHPLDPKLDSFFAGIDAFCWRPIAQTNRLSPHSFGIAIDLNPDKGPYWQWTKVRPHPMQKTFPPSIVALFEAHGFIWGGKWAHFDLMHFDYRPELIIKARKLAKQEG